MKNVFLITPKKNNSLLKEEIYKKGKHVFSILTSWKKCVLIVDKVPKPQLIDGVKTTEFANIDFKEGEYDCKQTLMLADKSGDAENKKIRKIFKDGFYHYSFLDEGWKLHKIVYRLKGELSSQNVPVHKITLCTAQIELVYQVLSKAEFEDFAANGMPQSLYDDAVDNTGFIFDASTGLSIDDLELQDFQNQFKVKYDKAVEDANFGEAPVSKAKEIQYAVVGESWTNRSWYDLTIYEDFDFSKIEVVVLRDYVFGKNVCYETFSIMYGESEFEFRENFGADSTDYCLIDSNGNQKDLTLFDDDDDDDDDDE
jgi:hypothetical protein